MFIHLPFLLLLPHLYRSNEDEEEKAEMAQRWTEPRPRLGLSLSRPEGEGPSAHAEYSQIVLHKTQRSQT